MLLRRIPCCKSQASCLNSFLFSPFLVLKNSQVAVFHLEGHFLGVSKLHHLQSPSGFLQTPFLLRRCRISFHKLCAGEQRGISFTTFLPSTPRPSSSSSSTQSILSRQSLLLDQELETRRGGGGLYIVQEAVASRPRCISLSSGALFSQGLVLGSSPRFSSDFFHWPIFLGFALRTSIVDRHLHFPPEVHFCHFQWLLILPSPSWFSGCDVRVSETPDSRRWWPWWSSWIGEGFWH